MRKTICLLTSIILLGACSKEKPNVAGDYPEEVGKIIRTKCATPACHSSVSSTECEGLDLSSWNKLFMGSFKNSVVIPFNSEHSILYASIDHNKVGHDNMMPKNGNPLSSDELTIIREWIDSGAKNRAGMSRFEDRPDRVKIFIANQGCDLVTVFDAETRLAMRYFQIGTNDAIEAPHDMFVTPDNKYLFISYFAGSRIQRYDAKTYTLDKELDLTDWGWHSMSVSGDSHYALVSHLSGDGKVALLDLNEMKIVVKYQGSGYFINPHGSTLNTDGSLAYIVSQQGNFIYKMNLEDPMNPEQEMISLDPGELPTPIGRHKPYEVEFSPDQSHYYVSCQGTNEIRIFNTSNDSLVSVISMPGVPQLMAFAASRDLMFVTCMADSSNSTTHSSVAIVNTMANSILKTIMSGNQPRGIVVDEENKVVYIANRNISPTGWTPHHTTSCGGRNGYVTTIDLNTLEEVKNWLAEVSVDPYCIAIKK